jgi:hypothetical protein
VNVVVVEVLERRPLGERDDPAVLDVPDVRRPEQLSVMVPTNDAGSPMSAARPE